MLYCYDENLPFDYSKREMAVSRIYGIGLLYDSENKIFKTFDNKKVDITGKIIFPRTGGNQIFDMNDAITLAGGIPVISNDDVKKVIAWPNYYTCIRYLKVFKGKDLLNKDIIDQIEKKCGKEIFFKTKKKNFSDIIDVDLLRDEKCAFYKTMQYHLDDEFIISERLNLTKDDYGVREYRCFVINNEIYNISRYTDDIMHSIDMEVYKKALGIVYEMIGKFPSCYVMDIFEYEKNGEKHIDVNEFNPIHASGLYLYNSVLKKSDDMLHRNIRCVATEYINMLDSFKINEQITNDKTNLYDIPMGFANDLKSICLVGERGAYIIDDTKLTIDDYRSHVKNISVINSKGELSSIVDFIEFKDIIKSDQDLITNKQLTKKNN